MDYRTLSALIRQFRRSGLHELEIALAAGHVRVRCADMPSPCTPPASEIQPAGTTVPRVEPRQQIIKSDRVGIFRCAKPEEKPAPAYSGCHLKRGDILGYIQAMNAWSPVVASLAAVITHSHVSEGQAVEFDQPLFSLKATEL